MADQAPAAGTAWLRSRAGVAALTVAGVVVILAIGAAAVLLFRGGEKGTDLDFAGPTDLKPAERDNYLAASKALPELQGATGTEQLSNLIGPPDSFEIAFSPGVNPGSVVREETWSYYDLASAFFFIDGQFLYAVDIDDPAPLTIINRRYSPLDFTAATTLDDVRKMLSDPELLVQVEVPVDYQLDMTLWAGEQLVVAFDATSAIFSVETVPAAALP